MMIQFLYQIIYQPAINRILRNINKAFYPVLPHDVRIPPSGILQLRKKGNKVLRIKTNQTSYLTQLLFWEGVDSFEYTDIFLSLIRKVNVFYDVGANIGYYSLLAAFENKNIKVVGFEPASGPLYYFKENIRINNFKNISIESIALSEQEGEIEFQEVKNKKYSYLEHNLAGESNAGSKTTTRNFVPTSVPTTTFDAYLNQVGEQKIDLIKMDTEGTEHLILKHAGQVLKQMKPIIICETLFNTIESNLEQIFKAHGYLFFNHTSDGLVKVDSIVREKDDGIRNCFFVHPDRYGLIEEFVR